MARLFNLAQIRLGNRARFYRVYLIAECLRCVSFSLVRTWKSLPRTVCCTLVSGPVTPKSCFRISAQFATAITARKGRRFMEIATSPCEKFAFVQRLRLFSDISPADCRTIVSSACQKRFSRRETIFFEGDPVRQVVLLLSGCVKITQLGFAGAEVILRVSGVGDLVSGCQPGAKLQPWFNGASHSTFHRSCLAGGNFR